MTTYLERDGEPSHPMTSQTRPSQEAIATRADDGTTGPVAAGTPARTSLEKMDEKKVSEKLKVDDVGVAQRERLQNVLLWLRTAKENLPDLNNGQVPADRVASASGLVDRLHRLALEAAAHGTARGRRQHRAA